MSDEEVKEAEKQEAYKVILLKLDQAKRLIDECESLADKHALEFNSPIGAYGMGGTYVGTGARDEDEYGDNDEGWVSSSRRC